MQDCSYFTINFLSVSQDAGESLYIAMRQNFHPWNRDKSTEVPICIENSQFHNEWFAEVFDEHKVLRSSLRFAQCKTKEDAAINGKILSWWNTMFWGSSLWPLMIQNATFCLMLVRLPKGFMYIKSILIMILLKNCNWWVASYVFSDSMVYNRNFTYQKDFGKFDLNLTVNVLMWSFDFHNWIFNTQQMEGYSTQGCTKQTRKCSLKKRDLYSGMWGGKDSLMLATTRHPTTLHSMNVILVVLKTREVGIFWHDSVGGID